MDQYQIDRCKAHIAIARYLLSKADERGYTHGQKHHIIQVCLGELVAALTLLPNETNIPLMPNAETDPTVIPMDDIPF